MRDFLTTAEKVIATGDRGFSVLVSWLFLVGSLIFLVDGILELTKGISIHALLHLSASLLFTVGSVLFMPQSEND